MCKNLYYKLYVYINIYTRSYSNNNIKLVGNKVELKDTPD